MKRRTTALLLLLALLLPLAGCGKTGTAAESGLAETPGSDKAQSGDKGKPQTGKNGTSQAGGAEQDDLLAPITSGDEPKAGLIPDAAIPMGDDLRWLDLAVCGHSLFWCAGGKVYRLDAPERSGEAWGKEGALFFDGFYVTKLASDGERLALCSSDGTVKLGTPSGMGFSDTSDFSLPIPAGCMTSGLVLAEDTIVFLWRESENGPDTGLKNDTVSESDAPVVPEDKETASEEAASEETASEEGTSGREYVPLNFSKEAVEEAGENIIGTPAREETSPVEKASETASENVSSFSFSSFE